jgi:uncharacterized membrane protein
MPLVGVLRYPSRVKETTLLCVLYRRYIEIEMHEHRPATKEGIMSSPASIKGHPIHAMLVAFPIGLWGFSLIADLVYRAGLGGPSWPTVAYYTLAGGLVGALLAAVPGLIDLISIRDARVKRIGLIHMIINLVVVALYAVNLYVRTTEGYSAATGVALSAIGVALLCASGWLGGSMVYRHGVAVDTHGEPLKHGR